MELSSTATCFFCPRTSEYVIYGDWIGHPLLYSSDGLKYFELKQTGFGGSTLEHNMHFEDPHHKRNGEFKRSGDILTWGVKVFEVTVCPVEVEFIPLPTVRKYEYLFKAPGGNFIYVSADKYNYSYESFKLFMGKPGKPMKEVRVDKVERYRDGGTTYIKTSKGTLFSPTPFDKKAKPTWADIKISAVKPDLYTIEESGDTVTINKK